MSFDQFGKAVAKQFQAMAKKELYRVAVDRDELWNLYLASFPPGTNPVYNTRTEHDCNTCKGFIRTLGGVVGIRNGQLITIWDVKAEGAYQVVADILAAHVRSCSIENVFRHTEPSVGKSSTWHPFAA